MNVIAFRSADDQLADQLIEEIGVDVGLRIQQLAKRVSPEARPPLLRIVQAIARRQGFEWADLETLTDAVRSADQ